ncbi:sodium:proton antiporter [Sphingomonas sp. KR1UV-12]|uniref:Sodium:proton antiporter n=1 Tax=Sphingomonas aurea TaxID=3063994 RepID=A0ABT9EJT0_9SPHN|nr:sodium:proton antiporter [Sphingomonas sp. KR1UV-12]MDP1027043.1 sodium:proton antiporter [Sphingomonas sp. KR1UV-12]
MRLFESLDAILVAALLLLVVARKLKLPYPTLLAAAGLGFAALPIAPDIHVEPDLALALFIAPALLHAAYHTSPRGLRRMWFPLLALAVVAVIVTTAAVTLAGVAVGGLSLAAAFVLGAIVAPPDAAASEAVLSEVGIPRRGMLLLQGESLLNDATALLLFGLALALATHSDTPATPWVLAAAVPGGILFGAVSAWGYLRVVPLFSGTLGSSLADFAITFAIWLLAERFHVSPVLAVVAFGMIVSTWRPMEQPARDRIQTSAVWSAAILVLNAVAFMLMGLQARDILSRLTGEERLPAIGFSLVVLATVLLSRLVWVFAVRAVEAGIVRRSKPSWLPTPAPWSASLILGWSGMRGLVTLAAAFAVPASVTGRDLIVLAAFTVVIGTLVIQGLTLGWLIRRLNVGEDGKLANAVGRARRTLIDAGLEALGDQRDDAANALRVRYGAAGHVVAHADDPQAPSEFDELHLRVLARQRCTLNHMRAHGEVPEDVYRRLLEELDWSEVEARSFAENELRPS